MFFTSSFGLVSFRTTDVAQKEQFAMTLFVLPSMNQARISSGFHRAIVNYPFIFQNAKAIFQVSRKLIISNDDFDKFHF